jgi:hypothetical protein
MCKVLSSIREEILLRVRCLSHILQIILLLRIPIFFKVTPNCASIKLVVQSQGLLTVVFSYYKIESSPTSNTSYCTIPKSTISPFPFLTLQTHITYQDSSDKTKITKALKFEGQHSSALTTKTSSSEFVHTFPTK